MLLPDTLESLCDIIPNEYGARFLSRDTSEELKRVVENTTLGSRGGRRLGTESSREEHPRTPALNRRPRASSVTPGYSLHCADPHPDTRRATASTREIDAPTSVIFVVDIKAVFLRDKHTRRSPARSAARTRARRDGAAHCLPRFESARVDEPLGPACSRSSH